MPNYVINSIVFEGSEKDRAAIVELLRNKDANSNEEVDFNNVIPMPKSMDLVSGGYDRQYVAAYIKTLSDADRVALAKKLESYPTSFYGNYFNKYKEAFSEDIPERDLEAMKKNFKESYKSINPSSIEEVGQAYVENIIIYGADTWYDWACENWGTKWGAMESTLGDGFMSFDTAWSASLPVTAKLSKMFPDVTFTHEWADEDIGSNCGRFIFKGGKTIDEYLPEGKEAVRFACGFWDYDPSDYLGEDYEVDSVEEAINDATAQSLNQENADKYEEKDIEM